MMSCLFKHFKRNVKINVGNALRKFYMDSASNANYIESSNGETRNIEMPVDDYFDIFLERPILLKKKLVSYASIMRKRCLVFA